jgi:hypothetical protein
MSKCIIDVLKKIGDLDWYECSPSELNEVTRAYPPYIVWRFKVENILRDQKIKIIVSSFAGQVEWTIGDNGRNWFITIKLLVEFYEKKDYLQFPKARRDFAEIYPEIGKRANQESHLLAKALEAAIIQG